MQKSPFLVFGASGVVGSEVARLLRAAGLPVRTTSSKKSAGSVQVDPLSGVGVDEAFAGVERAFILSPGGYVDQHALLSPLIAAARKHGLKEVVLMSALGANANEDAPLRKAEIELERSGVPYNIIRPNWFMQNFQTFWIQGIKESGTIFVPAAQSRTSFIDARDIAAAAVRLLQDDSLANRAFDLTGPQSLSYEEAASILGEAVGRTIRYQSIPPETLKKGLVAAGLSEAYSDFLLLLFSFVREGYNAGVNGQLEELLGRPAFTLKDYARAHKAAWA